MEYRIISAREFCEREEYFLECMRDIYDICDEHALKCLGFCESYETEESRAKIRQELPVRMFEEFRDKFERYGDGYFLSVAVENGVVCGLCSFYHGGARWYINDLATAVGKECVARDIISSGLEYIDADAETMVYVRDEQAIELYESLGFAHDEYNEDGMSYIYLIYTK